VTEDQEDQALEEMTWDDRQRTEAEVAMGNYGTPMDEVFAEMQDVDTRIAKALGTLDAASARTERREQWLREMAGCSGEEWTSDHLNAMAETWVAKFG